MHARGFSTDAGSGDDGAGGNSGSNDSDSAEFVFDGFKVMFAQKVMLTPVAPVKAPAVLTQTQSRRYS